MVPNDALINAVRSLGFRFKKQTQRTSLYKQPGTTKRVLIRRNARHDERYARVLLAQAGMRPRQIDRFIAEASD